MRLILIDDISRIEPNVGDYIVDYTTMKDKAYHPYIASNKWDEVLVYLGDDLSKFPRGYLVHLTGITRKVRFRIMNKEAIDTNKALVVAVLSELYKDFSRQLRLSLASGTYKMEIEELEALYGF